MGLRLKPRLLYWSDTPTGPSGFGRVGRNLACRLAEKWDVAYLGIGHLGDPHDLPIRLYPANPEGTGDMFGFSRLGAILEFEKPDVMILNMDLWVVAQFLSQAANLKHRPKIIAYSPIDSPGVKREFGEKLSELDLFVSYTDFGLREMRDAGFWGEAIVAPHGIDRSLYQPRPNDVRRSRILGDLPADAFVIGNVNRNQPRKRLDLTLMYFAEWARRGGDGWLYLHCANRDDGWDLRELARQLGVGERVRIAVARKEKLPPESEMPKMYSALDVQVSTTLGEGWGLTTLEGMACGIPQIVPDWSALGDWARPAAKLVPCTGREALFGFNTFGLGGVVDQEVFIAALDEMRAPATRAEYARRGLELVNEDRFRWDVIAEQFHLAMVKILKPQLRAVG